MALGVILVVAGKLTYVLAEPEPLAPTLHAPEGAYAVLLPAQVIVRVVTDELTVPVLVMAT